MEFWNDFMKFYNDLMEFENDLKEFENDLMEFENDLMEFYTIWIWHQNKTWDFTKKWGDSINTHASVVGNNQISCKLYDGFLNGLV